MLRQVNSLMNWPQPGILPFTGGRMICSMAYRRPSKTCWPKGKTAS
ncbi:UNVERIFIED_CONTAM: hypothetical protein GTU68_045886 [Idotea baltica]|nr:hypothetical protein [Idotea baltica]